MELRRLRRTQREIRREREGKENYSLPYRCGAHFRLPSHLARCIDKSKCREMYAPWKKAEKFHGCRPGGKRSDDGRSDFDDSDFRNCPLALKPSRELKHPRNSLRAISNELRTVRHAYIYTLRTHGI